MPTIDATDGRKTRSGGTHSHSATIGFRVHRLSRLAESGQQLEVVDVEGRGVGVEELGGLVVRVGKSVRRARRDGDVVS